MQPAELEARVRFKRAEAEGVVSLVLEAAGGELLPAWEPGAHVDLLLGREPVRQYSLCGDPGDRTTYRLGVLREPEGSGTSRFIHDDLCEGDTVRVRGPRNNFALLPASSYLFVAGGIGITPLLPMIATAQGAGADWRLLYGGRTRSSMAFIAELEAYGDRVSICPQDEEGLLDLDVALAEARPGTLIYCCGPEPLLRAVEQRCGGALAEALHLERFAPKEQLGSQPNEAFEVYLKQSDLTLHVPADRAIADLAEEAGVDVLYSCSEGTCGTCETPVVEGEPDHRDSVLTEAEQASNACMMICVSRSRTPRLVLDL